ncbi:MAG: TolC family protein [Deltaproteobacteria bacterium]
MTGERNGASVLRDGIFLLFLVFLLPAGPAAAQEAPRPVSYYVDSALSKNPSLSAMQERIRMRENAAIRAGALDNPKGWVAVTNVPVRTWSFREEDMTGKEIGISQMFPYPGKRGHLTRIGMLEKEQTGHDLEEMRNMLRAEIKMAYAELFSVRKQVETVRRTRDVLRDIVEVTREMYAVGKAGQADVLRGQLEFGKMREMLLMLENRERVLSVRLNTLAALPPVEAVPPLEELKEFAIPYTEGKLMAMYEESRSARKSLQAKVRKGEVGVLHAEHEYRPDFELSFSYMQRDSMQDGTRRPDMFTGMLSMTLPIWKNEKIEPGIREMKAERDMAARELENLDLETSNIIGATLSSMENRASVAALYRTTLVPQAEQALEANMEAYRVGKIDFPMLMDAVMAVLTFRKEYPAMVGELHMEKAKLEAAVGRELPGGDR